jgi:hypothetical protein
MSPGIAKMTKDYAISDLKLVYQHTQPKSWNDILRWLNGDAVGNARLTPGEVDAMKEDIQKLKDDGTPFISDFEKAFSVAHKNRS